MKTIRLRAKWLEIAVSFYSLAKGLRAIYCLEKNPRSKIRKVGCSSQVIGRDTVSSFHSYYLWKFGSFLCFFSFVVSLICNRNKYSRVQKRHNNTLSPIVSLFVILELKGYLSDLRFSFVSALWKLYKTSFKGILKPQWTQAFAYTRS